jgi:NADPH:quinone reductase-like Zn-dependent oxidoreductase
VDLMPIILKALRVIGNNTGSVADLASVAQAVAAARIEPVVDRVFSPSSAAEAYALMASGGRYFGKIVFSHAW